MESTGQETRCENPQLHCKRARTGQGPSQGLHGAARRCTAPHSHPPLPPTCVRYRRRPTEPHMHACAPSSSPTPPRRHLAPWRTKPPPSCSRAARGRGVGNDRLTAAFALAPPRRWLPQWDGLRRALLARHAVCSMAARNAACLASSRLGNGELWPECVLPMAFVISCMGTPSNIRVTLRWPEHKRKRVCNCLLQFQINFEHFLWSRRCNIALASPCSPCSDPALFSTEQRQDPSLCVFRSTIAPCYFPLFLYQQLPNRTAFINSCKLAVSCGSCN